MATPRLTRAGRLGIAAAVVLLAAGMLFAMYHVAEQRRAQRQAAGGPAATRVAITASSCEPAELTVPAGRTTFRVENRSDRALEWEILSGVMVVDERENIAPGFAQELTSRLGPGEYEITCGLLSNPRGRLRVVADASAPAGPARTAPRDLLGPLAEYEVFVIGELEELKAAAGDLAQAVRAGDLERAKGLYVPAREHYGRIRPVAGLVGDLDARIDARADVLAGREDDPGFLGFHRLEHGLFAKGSTDGLAPVADKLVADIGALDERLGATTPAPERMIGGAAVLMREAASVALAGGEERYAHADLADVAANLEGTRKLADLLSALTRRADPTLGGRVTDGLARADGILARYRRGDGGYQPPDRMTSQDRDALRAALNALAEDLTGLPEALGLV